MTSTASSHSLVVTPPFLVRDDDTFVFLPILSRFPRFRRDHTTPASAAAENDDDDGTDDVVSRRRRHRPRLGVVKEIWTTIGLRPLPRAVDDVNDDENCDETKTPPKTLIGTSSSSSSKESFGKCRRLFSLLLLRSSRFCRRGTSSERRVVCLLLLLRASFVSFPMGKMRSVFVWVLGLGFRRGAHFYLYERRANDIKGPPPDEENEDATRGFPREERKRKRETLFCASLLLLCSKKGKR